MHPAVLRMLRVIVKAVFDRLEWGPAGQAGRAAKRTGLKHG
jgi:hypothetical protein